MGGKGNDKIADHRTDHAYGQHAEDVFAEFGIGDTGQPQQHGKCGHAHQVADRLFNVQGVFHIARDPVGHGVLGTAAKEDAGHAKRKPHGALARAVRLGHLGLPLQIGHGREHEHDGGNDGQSREKQRQIHPVFLAEQCEECGADHNDEQNAKGVERVQCAHVALGIVRGERRDGGGQHDLGKPCCDGENDRARQQSRVGVLRQKRGHERVDHKSQRGDQWRDADKQSRVEFLGKERKQQIHQKLGAEVGQHQRAKQGVGNIVGILQGGKQQRRQDENRGHGKICAVAGKLCALEIGCHNVTSHLENFARKLGRQGKTTAVSL